MTLEGAKVAVLIEADYYEPEIWYYQRRFPEEGAEVHVWLKADKVKPGPTRRPRLHFAWLCCLRVSGWRVG